MGTCRAGPSPGTSKFCSRRCPRCCRGAALTEPRVAAPGSTLMRILHVAEAFGGGVFEVVRLLAERSAEQGHPSAIAYGRRGETPQAVRDRVSGPVELHAMPWTSRTAGAQVAAARRLRELVGEWRPDVVHLHSSFAGLIGQLAVPRGIPTVYTPQAYSFTMRTNPLMKTAYRLAEAFVARRVTVV